MTAENQDFSVYKGDARRLVIPILDGDNQLKALNVAELDFEWEVKLMPHGTRVIIKTLIEGGVIIDDASAGKVSVAVKSADTQTLTVGKPYKHYLRAIDAEGEKYTVTSGDLVVKL